MKIRLTQIDGNDPNLAIMQLSSYFKSIGADVYYKPSILKNKGEFEPVYDYVFASAIFSSSTQKVKKFLYNFPSAIIGGTWTFQNNEVGRIKEMFPKAQMLGIDETVETYLGLEKDSYPFYDYSIFPNCDYSIGFTQRGCKLRCPFCVVPTKEGKNYSLNYDIKFLIEQNQKSDNKLMINDNDFTNQPRFEERCNELIMLGTKVCIQQGINTRLIDFKKKKLIGTNNEVNQSQAKLLSRLNYRDRQFKKKRIYTAWDNARDEKHFWRGINLLVENGFKPQDIRVYFLCIFWQKGLSEDVWYRFTKMVEFGLDPYVMIFEKWTLPPRHDLTIFKSWVNGHYYNRKDVSRTQFEEFKKHELNRKKKQKDYSNSLFTV